jgi:hypothetical protein
MDIIMVDNSDDDDDEEKPIVKKKDKDTSSSSRMPRQTPSGTGERGGSKKSKEEKDLFKAVDKSLSAHMTPSQRRKADAGA